MSGLEPVVTAKDAISDLESIQPVKEGLVAGGIEHHTSLANQDSNQAE